MFNTFKIILRSIREYKKPALLTPLFMVGEVLCECIIPIITAQLINGIRANCGMDLIVKYGMILLALAFVSLFCGIMGAKYSAEAAAGFAKNLRHDIFIKVQDFSFANIDKFSTGSIVSRMTTDITNVQMAFMMIIRVAIRSPLMLIFACIASILVGKKLAWVFAGTIPILTLGLFFIASKVMGIFKAIFKRYDRMNEGVEENVKAARVVKSFVREDYESRKFENTSNGIRKDFTHAETILAFNAPIMMFCVYASMIFISFFAAKLIISTGATYLDVGALTSMITYSMQVLMSLMMLSMIFVFLTISVESAKRIAEILEEKPSIVNPEEPVMNVADGSIDFENVDFKYNENAKEYALSDIDLHINAGETIGIIGGTGTGKTTLIQLISRLYDVTSGSVKVGGVDVRDYDLKTLRDQVSVVLQKNVLFTGTVKDNLRWGDPDATEEEMERICKLAQADEFIQQFPDKYDHMIEQGGNNVSGGQKQRLCIARALLKKPKILILDDSTSAVDTKTDALIRSAFASEIPDTTKLIIAQRIGSVQDADRILVLDGGRVNGFGTHEELLANNTIYREVYESQTKGDEKDA